MSKISSFLQEVQVGEQRRHSNMHVYPLRVSNGHKPGYLTLDEALASKEFEVGEVNEGGSVPELQAKNRTKRPVLLILGEELVGAKQNRTLNTSLLVPAETDLEIPVSCVEQGRWRYRSRRFGSGSSGHSTLRFMKQRSTSDSLREGRGYKADQGEVWGEVSRAMHAHDAYSETSSMADMYEQREQDLQAYAELVGELGKAEGVLVAIDGRIVGADLFDTAETIERLWPKLVKSYALDALETARQNHEEAPAKEVINSFLGAAQTAKQETYDSVGLGRDVRLSGQNLIGSGLVWDEQVVHVSLFQMPAEKSAAESE